MINRRGILVGIGSILSAPAIVHAGNLMPIKAIDVGYRIEVKGTDQYGNYVSEILYMDKAPVSPIHRISFIADLTKLATVHRIITPDVYVMV